LVFFVGFWLAGTLDDSQSAALSQRLASVEKSVRDMANQPAPAGSERRALEELAARLDRLETASATQPAQTGDPAVATRLASVEQAVAPLQRATADLARRIDDNAAATREAQGRAEASLLAADTARATVERSDFAAISSRISALEQTAKTLADEVAKSAAAAGGDRSLRLALATQALRTAVERGDPFAAELAAAKPVAPDPQALTPLEAFAASGVPTRETLARELAELVPAMRRLADAPTATGNFLDRLQANAERLVRIRPIEEASGDDSIAVITRIDAMAARLDIPGALSELAKLPAPVRAPAEKWIKTAEWRGAAVAASRRLASDALAALGQAP
jgi:hypothetical protein